MDGVQLWISKLAPSCYIHKHEPFRYASTERAADRRCRSTPDSIVSLGHNDIVDIIKSNLQQ